MGARALLEAARVYEMSKGAVYKALKIIRDQGLILETRNNKGEKMAALSHRGIQVARYIHRIHEILEKKHTTT
jgi:DNA-binding PadR family transcriptional regulator